MGQSKRTRSRRYVILMTLAAAVPAVAGEGTAMRLERAAAVLNAMTDPIHGIKPEHLASADCIVVIPGFKIRAAVVGRRLRSWVHVLPERRRVLRARRRVVRARGHGA